MNLIVEKLRAQEPLQQNFSNWCGCVAAAVPIQHAGLAQLTPDGVHFELLAEWEGGTATAGVGRRFERAGTVGELVLRRGSSFVGPTIDAVRRYPATLQSLRDKGFQSNYVARLQDSPARVLFLLSEQSGALGHETARMIDESLNHLREAIGSAERMAVLSSYADALDASVAECIDGFVGATRRHPTLAEIEAAYLRHLSKTSKFRIEGMLGGASLSGLKPSTLRYRLERLDVVK